MNAELFYKRNILDMLSDNSFYKQIGSPSTKDTMNKIRKLTKLAKETTCHKINYLLNFDYKTRNHKSKLIKEEFNKIQMI